MLWKDRHGHSIPDFDDVILNVSERAKALIEQVERGVHQFVSVDYLNAKGDLLERRYFLIVCKRIDSIDRAHSRMRLEKGIMWTPDGVENPKLVFSRAQIGNAHLWRDKHLTAGPFVSDELAKSLQDSGMTGLRLSESKAENV